MHRYRIYYILHLDKGNREQNTSIASRRRKFEIWDGLWSLFAVFSPSKCLLLHKQLHVKQHAPPTPPPVQNEENIVNFQNHYNSI